MNNIKIDRIEEEEDRHLFRLGELDDYKVAGDDPDVRGWTIFGKDHREIGVINELIVDPDREKVRYLDVVPSKNRPDDIKDHHLLIPIGLARLDREDDRVIVDEIDRNLLNSYPVYRSQEVTREHEYAVVERLNSSGSIGRGRNEQGDFYDNRLYDEDRFYSSRNRSQN